MFFLSPAEESLKLNTITDLVINYVEMTVDLYKRRKPHGRV